MRFTARQLLACTLWVVDVLVELLWPHKRLRGQSNTSSASPTRERLQACSKQPGLLRVCRLVRRPRSVRTALASRAFAGPEQFLQFVASSERLQARSTLAGAWYWLLQAGA